MIFLLELNRRCLYYNWKFWPFNVSLAGRQLSHRVAAEYGTGGRLGWQSAGFCQTCRKCSCCKMHSLVYMAKHPLQKPLHSFHRGRSSHFARLMFPNSHSCTNFTLIFTMSAISAAGIPFSVSAKAVSFPFFISPNSIPWAILLSHPRFSPSL